MKALDVAASVPWAIQPDALHVMLALAAREDISRQIVAAAMTDGSPEAVAARLGKPLENTRATTVRDGVAVIPIGGPIFRHANLFSEISGATTTEAIAQDLTIALDDPAVTAILLEIDSPGGEIAGISELAQMIRDACARKPVAAYVDHLGASAAYWLAAAASTIVAAPTAMLGSIGVVMVLNDPAKTDSTDLELVSSQSPKKRPDLTTKGGRAQVQATVDALAEVFIADVARFRGVSAETVASDFGRGDVFVGQHAVDAGLADSVGSFEQTLRAAAEPQQAPAPIRALPAIHERPAAPGKKVAMGMREQFFAWLDGVDATASADQEAAIVTANLNQPVTAPATAPQPATAAADDEAASAHAELAAARAEIASRNAEVQRLRMEALTREAAIFADETIRDGQAMPSERAAIIDAFTQASVDDGALGAVAFGDGRKTSRVEIVKRQYADRKSVRALYTELVGDDVLMALHQRQASPRKADDEAPTSDEVTKLIGMTPFGQACLTGKNGAAKH